MEGGWGFAGVSGGLGRNLLRLVVLGRELVG